MSDSLAGAGTYVYQRGNAHARGICFHAEEDCAMVSEEVSARQGRHNQNIRVRPQET